MPKLAKLIRVVREGDKVSLTVDGVEFPWHIDDGPGIDVLDSTCPAVNVSILAERVEVVNALDAPKDERVEDEAELIRGLE